MTSHRMESSQASLGSPKRGSAAKPMGAHRVKARLWTASFVMLGAFACLDRKAGSPDASTGDVAVDVAGRLDGQGGMTGQGGGLDVSPSTGTGGAVLARQDGSIDVTQSTGTGGTLPARQDGSVDLPQGTGAGGVIPIGQGGTGAGGALGQGGNIIADAPVDQTLALPVGAACQTNGECTLGNCIDGFCCASACAGCNACSNALTGKANGTCAPALSGQDPHETCADETASNQCGNDGTCDGAGACRKVTTSHTCTQASCSSDGQDLYTRHHLRRQGRVHDSHIIVVKSSSVSTGC